MTTFDIGKACEFLAKANSIISSKQNESVVRHNISAALPQMFPEAPWWITEHVSGSEAQAEFHKAGQRRRGFVDALVGSTAIEYERNIDDPKLLDEGFGQVADYCANVLNSGIAPDLIVGVLSDTVRWKAYRIREVKPLAAVVGSAVYGRDHLVLEEIDACDLSAAGPSEARQLGVFLERHLGRLGSRRLNAGTLATDLGFDSRFSAPHLDSIHMLVDDAFASNAEYAGLIEKLWNDFVSYLGGESVAGGFDRKTYASELYILTLAKLICANILSGRALSSDDAELASVLDGKFFQNRGLSNLVEYDYFGWLNAPPHVFPLLPIARAIQDDLIAYDFASPPAEDLFGQMMAQLAERSQRLLLGQEWTPSWLADAIVGNVMAKIPPGQAPRLVDMCCGSGAMVVEAVKHSKAKLLSQGLEAGSQEAIAKLTDAITGFDIDPLAVMLAKIGWVLAARDWLGAATETTIPVYHADSLFAATPLAKVVDETGATHHEMSLDGMNVSLPSFLVTPTMRPLFDLLMDRCYAVAMASAKASASEIDSVVVEGLVSDVVDSSGCSISPEERRRLIEFAASLLNALESLQRAGRNGIWAFVLRNSYRPGLVAGEFNGLVSNPPWLALSKIASNPYTEALRERAKYYGITPPGPAHLHVEMATIFLLHAVERYLTKDSTVGCVLPESIMSAHNHNPFRMEAYASATRPVALRVDELWRVEKGTFKNEAVVLFGTKAAPTVPTSATIPGKVVSRGASQPIIFNRIVRGQRTAWSENNMLGANNAGFFKPAAFRQGADVMPRTLVFHSFARGRAVGTWNAAPITTASSERYLKADAKTHKSFSLTASGLSDKVLFNVLLSHHLTPFDIGDGAKGILPITRTGTSGWVALTSTQIASMGAATSNAFNAILSALGAGATTQGYFDRIDTDRHKLTNQSWTKGWLVFMGAGGSNVCAAYAPAARFPQDKTVIDQTLYWAVVPSEDEALYLTGLLNSNAVNSVIGQFQPRGQFGARHVHKLPLGATPPYDPSDPAHADVVAKTKLLLADWNAHKSANLTLAG